MTMNFSYKKGLETAIVPKRAAYVRGTGLHSQIAFFDKQHNLLEVWAEKDGWSKIITDPRAYDYVTAIHHEEYPLISRDEDCEYVVADYSNPTDRGAIIVSRHRATIDYLRRALDRKDIHVFETATADDVRHRDVYGNVPLHLAACAARVTAVEFHRPLPIGADMDIAAMEAAGVQMTHYVVHAIEMAANGGGPRATIGYGDTVRVPVPFGTTTIRGGDRGSTIAFLNRKGQAIMAYGKWQDGPTSGPCLREPGSPLFQKALAKEAYEYFEFAQGGRRGAAVEGGSVIVSRHPATIEWLRRELGREDIPVLAEADVNDVCEKHVYGNVPLRLARYAACVSAVEFGGDAPRGSEYDIAAMDAAGAHLAHYCVERWSRCC